MTQYYTVQPRTSAHLRQVVLHDVADDAVLVKVAAPALGPKVLLERDLLVRFAHGRAGIMTRTHASRVIMGDRAGMQGTSGSPASFQHASVQAPCKATSHANSSRWHAYSNRAWCHA